MSSRGQAAKLPWRKPVLYDLTGYLDTEGTPMHKSHFNDPAEAEDEFRPPGSPTPTKKTYRPLTAPA